MVDIADSLAARGLTRKPKDILLLGTGQSNMAGWTAGAQGGNWLTSDLPDTRIRVFDKVGRGPELITNDDLKSGTTTGYTGQGCTLANVNGKLEATAITGNHPYVYSPLTGLTVGTAYEVLAEVETPVCGVIVKTDSATLIGGNPNSQLLNVGTGLAETIRMRFAATATSHQLQIVSAATGTTTPIALFERIASLSTKAVLTSGTAYPIAVPPLYGDLDYTYAVSSMAMDPSYAMAQQLLAAGIASRVTIIPTAIGGTGLVGGPWAVGGSRQSDTVAKFTAALADNPLASPIILWGQGEADGDNNVTRDAYKTAWKATMASFRACAGAASAPIIISGMVPEYISARPGIQIINDAHQQLTNEVSNTFFALGPVGYQQGTGNLYHYNRAGSRLLGKALASQLSAIM